MTCPLRSNGIVTSSTASELLDSLWIVHRTYLTSEEMLVALDSGVLGAMVEDDAVLRYRLKSAREEGRFESLSVLPYRFERQNYGFALVDDSPYEEVINQTLLKIRKSKRWLVTARQLGHKFIC